MTTLIIIAIWAAGIWYLGARRYWRLYSSRAALAGIPSFSSTYYFVDLNGSAVAIDEIARIVAFVDAAGDYKLYRPGDIISVDVSRTSVSSTRTTNRLSQLFSAIIWKIFFGEKGFWVGGMTGEYNDERET